MKICIVTVYDSINSGSFWQAKALETFFKDRNNDVFVLKNNWLLNLKQIFDETKLELKLLIRHGYSRYKSRANMYKNFKRYQKGFNAISLKKAKKLGMDLIVLGSDTIWNFDSKYFEKNSDRYIGMPFYKISKIISYAASSSNTSLNKTLQIKDFPKMLEYYTSISVRDENTKKIIENITSKKIYEVCDPTLLYNKEYYQHLAKRIEKDNYIYLYLFDDLSNNQKKEIEEFASKNNLKIINGTTGRCKMGKSVDKSPYSFINYMVYADYVITDTFHGTVFSVNLERPFVVINRDTKKVNYFLKYVQLSSRLINSKSELIKVLTIKIDYTNTNEILNKLRYESSKFLDNSITQITK